MSIDLDLQIACEFEGLPSQSQIELWANQALISFKEHAELTVRITDEIESKELNSQYRGKESPTNVLSFPFEAPPGIDLPLIGDLIICPHIVKQESIEQEKTFHAHFAHMVIHGCLHLIGFDHINEKDAEEMENLEKTFLSELGISDPYRDDE